MSTQYWSDPTLPTPIFITHPSPDLRIRCEIFLREFAKILPTKQGQFYYPTPEEAETHLCALMGYLHTTHFTPSEPYPYHLLHALIHIPTLKTQYQQLRDRFQQIYNRPLNITINVTHKYYSQRPHTS